jgi:hypothetical protein
VTEVLSEESRFGIVLVLNAYIQQSEEHDPLVFSRDNFEHTIDAIDLDRLAYCADGNTLQLTDDELVRLNWFVIQQRLDQFEGFIERIYLGDGRMVAVQPLLHGYALLGIGDAKQQWFVDQWQFETVGSALQVLRSWDPDKDKEPPGWVKHPGTGRYRPGGDPAKEYVQGEEYQPENKGVNS